MSALRSLLLTAGPILLLIAGAPSKAGWQARTVPPNETGGAQSGTTASAIDRLTLAQRLTRSGALFYGAWWCPHCSHQKELFGGRASAFLPYVECDRDDEGRRRCATARVRAYPTWVIGAERREGVLSLEELQAWLNTITPTGQRDGTPAATPARPPGDTPSPMP
ncbi:MAG: hypothetical protein ACKOCM_00555 [Cyanobacteriota bacterium]